MNRQAEMGIYRDNLSAIAVGDNLLPIVVIAQNSFDLVSSAVQRTLDKIANIAFIDYRLSISRL